MGATASRGTAGMVNGCEAVTLVPGKWSSEGESNPHRPVRSRVFYPLNYLTIGNGAESGTRTRRTLVLSPRCLPLHHLR